MEGGTDFNFCGRRPRFQGVKKNAKKRSVAQMKDQVMTIKTHTESSKSELSSGTFDHFKGDRPAPAGGVTDLSDVRLNTATND